MDGNVTGTCCGPIVRSDTGAGTTVEVMLRVAVGPMLGEALRQRSLDPIRSSTMTMMMMNKLL